MNSNDICLWIVSRDSYTYLRTAIQGQRANRVAGVNPLLYAGHSFRIGSATTAAAADIPAHMIKRLGRWS